MNSKKIIILSFLLIIPLLTIGQARDYWNSSTPEPSEERVIKSVNEISEYKVLGLDLQDFKSHISKAPFRGNDVESSVVMAFPTATGKLQNFKMFRVHTLSPELAAKFPSISSYVGVSLEKKLRIRVTLTNQGMYGMITGGEGDIFINPMTRSGSVYKVFNMKNASRSQNLMNCLVRNTEPNLPNNAPQGKPMTDDGILRTYELAVATTAEFSQFHINAAGVNNGTISQKIAAVMSAITVTIDRVNEIYERDLAVTLTLVANNDNLIYLDSNTDPFTNSDISLMIDESKTVINNTIGSNNYDIGHTFSTFPGGLAQIFSVCSANKARGVSGTFDTPVGDPFAISFVCHEMGHQFGANHTFNNSCGNNRNDATAVEPGSGVTIMAYAGICPPDVQNTSAAMFHRISLDEITINLQSGPANGCATNTTINNTPPTIDPVPNYTIPYGTAFVLTANTSDADSDAMTYAWDQINNEVAVMPPSPTSTIGPNFRSFEPMNTPTRYFPSLNYVLAENLTPTWEVVPNVARSMGFALTVRDNNIMGGQTATEYSFITFANTGPFMVTSQNSSGVSYDQNQPATITWDVAGTTSNGIDTPTVDILISYLNGAPGTFQMLVENAPNDGSQFLFMPSGTASGICRLMVKGHDNIFFDINNEIFTITDQIWMSTQEFTESSFSIAPNPNNGEFTLSFGDNINGEMQTVIFDIRGRKVGQYKLNTQTGSGSVQTIKMNQPQPGIYLLQVSDGTRTITKKLIIK